MNTLHWLSFKNKIIMNKSIIYVLIFFLVLVVLFWLMPNNKIEVIGDFLKKIVDPLAIPLATMIGVSFGIIKYKQIYNKDQL